MDSSCEKQVSEEATSLKSYKSYTFGSLAFSSFLMGPLLWDPATQVSLRAQPHLSFSANWSGGCRRSHCTTLDKSSAPKSSAK